MRTHYCGEVVISHIGTRVELVGWVQRRRDHGGVIFLDLRDRSGIVQTVVDSDAHDIFAIADQVRGEYVLHVTGAVRARPQGSENPEIPTGEVEVLAQSLVVLNTSETPPFELDDYSEAGEDVRLRYRYLDLRRTELSSTLMLRARATRAVRQYLDEQGCVEIETPMLTRSTPEGARDYLVPSRTHPGEFFALPQSPQLFKQLLMMAGMDRYYQIVRCFRDEDLRADRQPEFTQIDIEVSFANEETIMELTESMLRHVFGITLDVHLPAFPRLTWHEAMRLYGCDRPDLRNPLQLTDLDDLLTRVEFKVFAGPAADAGGRVAVLRAPGAAKKLTRKGIDQYVQRAMQLGAGGLAFIKVNDVQQGIEGLQSPILKFLPAEVLTAILQRTAAESGDLLFFAADKFAMVCRVMADLRDALGRDLGLTGQGWAPCWVTRFPLFERDQQGSLTSAHHPFTAPECDVQALRESPDTVLARSYDVVLNGYEIGGGSVRINQAQVQRAVLELIGLGADNRFDFLLEAMGYGCPPHAGIALGMDRIVMLLAGKDSLRDVIAFPKTHTAACSMTSAPSPVDARQLAELHLRLSAQASATLTDTRAPGQQIGETGHGGTQ